MWPGTTSGVNIGMTKGRPSTARLARDGAAQKPTLGRGSPTQQAQGAVHALHLRFLLYNNRARVSGLGPRVPRSFNPVLLSAPTLTTSHVLAGQ